MTRRTLPISYARWKSFVDLADFMGENQINGFGQYFKAPTPGSLTSVDLSRPYSCMLESSIYLSIWRPNSRYLLRQVHLYDLHRPRRCLCTVRRLSEKWVP